jgi:eukaryotic-like serine/threonine-protein kinase
LTGELVAGRFRVERPLGHGAMATVDLARDVELDRRVALKRLAENSARDDDLRTRFVREARLAARLADPHVVRVYDVGEDAGRPFIAMEYVEGETLAEVVGRRGALPVDEAVGLGIQLCHGLAAVHRAGLVHRDVKPHNLLLRTDGQLKLGDFGIAFRTDGTRLTVAGTVLGTAAYLAPEQARGDDVTAAADIYAVGAVLYELLTGRPVRTPSTLAELAEVPEIEHPSGVPPAVVRVVLRCLEPEPADRPPSAADVAHELAAALPDVTTVALPERPARRPAGKPRPLRARTTVLVIAAVLAIAGGTAAAIATSVGGGSPPSVTPPPVIAPVQPGATAEDGARNLAAWLLRYSR